MHNTSSCGVFYPKDDALKAAIPADMLKAAQDQHSNNQDARVVRLRQLLCPLLGDLNSRNDYIVAVVASLARTRYGSHVPESSPLFSKLGTSLHQLAIAATVTIAASDNGTNSVDKINSG